MTGLWLFFAMVATLLAVLAFAGNAGAVTLTGGTGTDPWISSDLPDYAPGSTVNLLGGSWQPGESVHIYVNDSDGQTWVFNDDVTADADGDISDSFNLPNWFVASYAVTATGASGSVATTSFTDGNLTSVSGTVTDSATSAAIAGATVKCDATSGCNGTFTTTTDASGSYSFANGNKLTFSGNGPTTLTLTVSKSGYTTGTITLSNVSNSQNLTGKDIALAPACTPASVITQPGNQSIMYGESATFTAAGGGSPAPAVQWQVDSGTGFTNLSGQSSTTLTLTKPTVSMSGNKYRAVFTNTCGGTQTATTTAASLTVNRKPITITPDSGQSKVYGDDDPALTYSNAPALETGDAFTGALARAAGEDVGGYAITLGSLSAGDNYSLSLATPAVGFAITRAPLTVTADDTSRAYGDANPSFSASYSGFKRGETLATSGVTGSPSLTTAATASSNIGGYAISAALGSLDAANYSFGFEDGTLTITPATLSIDADDQAKTYGDGDPAASYTLSGFRNGEDATSAGVSGTADCSIGSHSENAGAYADVYSCGPGSLTAGNYQFVAGSNGKLTIGKKPASVTAEDKTKIYGSDDPDLTTTDSGFLAADLGAGKITFGATRAAGETVAGGPYAITPSASDAASNLLANYDVTYNDGQLTITRKTASVTAEDKSKVYGSDDPALTTTESGFLAADLGPGKITFGASRVAGETVAGGPYTITPSASDGASNLLGNYDVTYNDGQLTITKKPASVTAEDKSKVYGSDDPELTTTNSGFLAADLGAGKITFGASRAAGETVAGGPYTITPSASDGASNLLANYDVTYNDGQLTISEKPASVTAEDKTKVYGDPDPALTTTSSGFLAADLGAGKITFGASRAAGETVAGGPYTITPSASDGASNLLANYDVTFNPGQLTISRRPLTVTADNKSKTYDGNPYDGGFTRTISGFAFGETDSVVSGSVVFGGPAITGVDAGDYVITADVSGLSAANYSFSAADVNSGNLTINQRPITVAADPKTKVFGSPDPALTYGLTAGSLVGGDSLSGSLTRDPGELVGAYAIRRGGVTAGANYAITYAGASLTITAWNAAGKGFYAPVGADAAHSIFTAAPGSAPTTKPASMVWNTIKGGQTVPLKFNVFAGAVEKTTSEAFPSSDLNKAFQMQKLANCTDSVATDPIDYTATSGQTVLRYDTSGMQWIQNWATPRVSATTCYRTFVTFADGSTIEAFFQLTK
jgi:hypothetical protein